MAFLADLLFPKFCLGCGFLGAYICLKCRKKLSYVNGDVCPYCRKSGLYGMTHPGCRRENGIDGFISIFHYNNLVKSIVKSFKYRLATEVWREFCQVIEPEGIYKLLLFKKLLLDDLYLQPVPLFPAKLRLRGFNQAKLIAEYFNSFLKGEITELMERRKDTKPQAQQKTDKDRFGNLRGAFSVKEKLTTGKNFVLIDDVFTSGSTVKEAARALKLAGADKVYALTLARG